MRVAACGQGMLGYSVNIWIMLWIYPESAKGIIF